MSIRPYSQCLAAACIIQACSPAWTPASLNQPPSSQLSWSLPELHTRGQSGSQTNLQTNKQIKVGKAVHGQSFHKPWKHNFIWLFTMYILTLVTFMKTSRITTQKTSKDNNPQVKEVYQISRIISWFGWKLLW